MRRTIVETSSARLAEERGLRRESITWLDGLAKALFQARRRRRSSDPDLEPVVEFKDPTIRETPCAILSLERVNGATFAYVEERKGRKPEMKWSEFKQ